MKKIIISCIILNLLVIGTVFAAPQKGAEKPSGGVLQIGTINEARIMEECLQVKAAREEFNRQGQEAITQLEGEKEKLNSEEFAQKQQEVHGRMTAIKQQMEGQVQLKVQQAVEKVAKEKNMGLVLYQNEVFFGGIDITTEVMKKME